MNETRTAAAMLLLLLAPLGGCGGDEAETPAAAAATTAAGGGGAGGAGGEPPTFGGERPLKVFRVPAGYDAAAAAPLVLIVHGFSASGMAQNLFFRLQDIADAEGFFIAAPDGTVNSEGLRFWNATDACCDFEQTGVDDVAYLTGLVDEIAGAYSIDPKRIFVVGHSNGGFMGNRLACDAAHRFAAVVSLAGANWADPSKCNPSEPVGFLQIHGTDDDDVLYDGDPAQNFPSAEQTVATWADKNGCDATAVTGAETIDVDADVEGAETVVTSHGGCTPNGAAELWTIQGGGHIPDTAPDFPQRIYDFLAAHPKP